MPKKDRADCRCGKPEHLKGKPEDCTPEEVRKCHGEAGAHPCCGSQKQQE